MDVCGVCFTLPIWVSLLMVSHVWTKLFLNLQHPFHDTGSVDWIEIISTDCCLNTGCCATKSMVDLVVSKKVSLFHTHHLAPGVQVSRLHHFPFIKIHFTLW